MEGYFDEEGNWISIPQEKSKPVEKPVPPITPQPPPAPKIEPLTRPEPLPQPVQMTVPQPQTLPISVFLTRGPANTRRMYMSTCKLFLTFIKGHSPDNQWLSELERYMATTPQQQLEQDILKFIFDAVQSQFAPNTIRTRLRILHALLTWYGRDMSTQTKKQLGMIIPRVSKKIEEMIPTRQQLHQILNASPLWAKAFFAVLKSSGARPSELLALTHADIDMSSDPPCLTLRQTKTGEPRITFIDSEAKGILQEYLNTEPHTEKVFPYPLRQYRRAWKQALKVCGFYTKNKETKHKVLKMRLYTLRKYFRSYGREGIDRDLLEYLMGHRNKGVENAYINYTKDQLAHIYKKGEGALLTRP
jgi:integrase